MEKYKVIGSSSSGNAIIYLEEVLVDVGVSFNKLADSLSKIKVILLTHAHGDHFQLATINRIASERPDMLWLVPEHLISKIELIKLKNVIPVQINKKYRVGEYKIEVFELYHDISNVGYKIIKGDFKIVHATDTAKINHVSAKDFDLYAIEHNYDEMDVYDRIIEKQDKGLFAHEIRSLDSHLSFQKAQDWISSQRKADSEIIKLHVSSYYTMKENTDGE